MALTPAPQPANWPLISAGFRLCRRHATPVEPWEFDRALYRRRNHVERLFRRLKGFRRIFSRFDKLDVMFLGFLHFALSVEALR